MKARLMTYRRTVSYETPKPRSARSSSTSRYLNVNRDRAETTINLNTGPGITVVVEKLLIALNDKPEVRCAVAEALAGVELTGTPPASPASDDAGLALRFSNAVAVAPVLSDRFRLRPPCGRAVAHWLPDGGPRRRPRCCMAVLTEVKAVLRLADGPRDAR
jgi:hypothetical protein